MRVLIVRSDGHDADSDADTLERHGYEIVRANSGDSALAMHAQVDFIILDLGLPDADGLEVCQAIREVSETPVIAVTDRGNELDRVLGLKAGADDCVDRGCGMRELVARIEAVMRRSTARPATSGVIAYGPLHIDQSYRGAWLGGKPLKLTRKEFDLLLALASRPGVVLTRRELMSLVWNDRWTRGRTIDTHINSLRSKLGSNDWIVTVRGVGFRLGEWAAAESPAAPEPPQAGHQAGPHAVPLGEVV